MIETEADRLAYVEAFGDLVVRVRGQLLQAIFDNDYLGVPAGDLEIESRTPTLTCRTADVEQLQILKGDTVEGLGKPYRVQRHEPDGTGMSRLILSE